MFCCCSFDSSSHFTDFSFCAAQTCPKDEICSTTWLLPVLSFSSSSNSESWRKSSSEHPSKSVSPPLRGIEHVLKGWLFLSNLSFWDMIYSCIFWIFKWYSDSINCELIYLSISLKTIANVINEFHLTINQ